MNVIDHTANVIQSGGCVVMGIGVTPERYRFLLQDATNQDYVVFGPRNSADANLIASRMSGERLKPRSLSVLGVEIDAYLIGSDKRVE
jgi:hypothetical protein